MGRGCAYVPRQCWGVLSGLNLWGSCTVTVSLIRVSIRPLESGRPWFLVPSMSPGPHNLSASSSIQSPEGGADYEYSSVSRAVVLLPCSFSRIIVVGFFVCLFFARTHDLSSLRFLATLVVSDMGSISYPAWA